MLFTKNLINVCTVSKKYVAVVSDLTGSFFHCDSLWCDPIVLSTNILWGLPLSFYHLISHTKWGISYQFTRVLLFGIKSNDGDLRWLLNFDEHFTCHLRFSSHKED